MRYPVKYAERQDHNPEASGNILAHCHSNDSRVQQSTIQHNDLNLRNSRK